MAGNPPSTIDPPLRTKLKRGVAQPAYGQPGGGVEVIFVNGSPPKTVTGCADSTMTIRVPEKWTRFFVRQPESGMGNQRVGVRLANKSRAFVTCG